MRPPIGSQGAIGRAVREVADALEDGAPHAGASVPHYAVTGTRLGGRGAWSLTLRHYGTPILHADRDEDGGLSSRIDPAWWASRTDMGAIARAHRALGMRVSIRRGRLVAY